MLMKNEIQDDDYGDTGLTQADLDENPILQFEIWLRTAEQAGTVEANAMTLATVG